MLAIGLSLYIAMRLGMDSPNWAVTSALIVSVGTIGEIQAKWWQRIAGNTLGCMIGFFTVWWLAEDPLLIGLSACLFCSACTYISLTNFIYKDLWRWILMGFIIVFSASLSTPDKAYGILLARSGCVFIGSTMIFLLTALWPIDYIGSMQSQYYNLLTNLKNIADIDDEDALTKAFLDFSQKIAAFRMSLSTNYADYRAIHFKDVNIINRVYALEKLGRHLYSVKMQHGFNDEMKQWVRDIACGIKQRSALGVFKNHEKAYDESTVCLLNTDLQTLTQGRAATDEASMLRWQWQNRMFSSGTDSALTSSTLFFVTCVISLLLWRYGWPDGGTVMLLTAVLLIACQYGERISPRNYIMGFSVGTLYAFPLFIFLLPAVNNPTSFWLALILIYFPLAYVMYGPYKNKSINFLAFATAVMVNANSHNYIPTEGYFKSYINFVFVLVAVILVSASALSLCVVNNVEKRLSTQYYAWIKERRLILFKKNYNSIKTVARLERRADIIFSMYNKLSTESQEKWQRRVSLVPLSLTRIQRWVIIKRQMRKDAE